MKTQTGRLKKRLRLRNQPYVTADQLKSVLKTEKSSYSIGELVRRDIVTPIKQGKMYINNQSMKRIDKKVVGSLYFQGELYAYGGLGLANEYGMSTQIVDWSIIYNTNYSGKKIIGGIYKFIFKKVRESFFYGLEEEIRNEISIMKMTPERLLIQMVREGASLEFVQELPKVVDKQKLYAMADKYASKSVLSTIKNLYE